MPAASASALQGLRSNQQRLDDAAQTVAGWGLPAAGSEGVVDAPVAELNAAAVAQNMAVIGYKANLQVIRAQDAMLGSLVNLTA